MKLHQSITFQKFKDWGDALLKWASIVAIFIAGWWTLHLFNISDTDASNIEIQISTETKPYSEENRLMIVDVKPKNIGKIPVEAGKKGFVLTIRSIPQKLAIGYVDESKLPIFHRINISAPNDGGYLLEPGVEYDEVHAFIVPKGSAFIVNADFDLGQTTTAQIPIWRHRRSQPINRRCFITETT